jgi:hypothetical protein
MRPIPQTRPRRQRLPRDTQAVQYATSRRHPLLPGHYATRFTLRRRAKPSTDVVLSIGKKEWSRASRASLTRRPPIPADRIPLLLSFSRKCGRAWDDEFYHGKEGQPNKPAGLPCAYRRKISSNCVHLGRSCLILPEKGHFIGASLPQIGHSLTKSWLPAARVRGVPSH